MKTKDPQNKSNSASEDKAVSPEPPHWARALGAELLGTFALTFVAAGGLVIDDVSQGQVEYVAHVVAPGLLVMAMIYTLGSISGAHINPVVTLAFALRGVFAWKFVPWYWLAQFVGALSAAGTLLLTFGNKAHLGATLPHHGDTPALVMEFLLTTLLVVVIVGTASGGKSVGHNAALAVGGTVALCGMFAHPISGASMNPARSLGPALLSGDLDSIWIYIVGPTAGALLAVAFMWLLRGRPTQQEIKAASGDNSDSDKRQ